ncbi:putative xyloglucan-specific endo-beta-1,4-glucanase A [Colletotrichum tanaceti]|uniref:Putative xyloglucan-specific endo-beta-1,4-glucanase A n=1 Tax=Colletotrichum tanaceti TaxID=1306861 RepID=A0A4U6XFP2_9PEZI|nr:putative xyloglucan-specific endo-beta-1,4-glucanase A [Colletotrichum tanaceti]TKW54565.1 putative xyloglucan-specific endo-beta-1,4-glucanase A [Colletotrichum tanaceti]
MQFSSYLVSAILAVTAVATPTPVVVDKRATKMCDSWGSLTTGGLTVYHNNWGAGKASSGSQCTTFESLTSGSVAWSTSWTWTGGQGQVKSYSNVALEKVNKKLSDIKSIPSKWTWSYSGSNLVADVAYDLWLAPSVGANNKYEIMIWLSALGGALPISSTGKTIDTPTIAGTKWSVYSGPNEDTTVYSFVAPSDVKSFNGDLMGFFNYLTSKQGVAKTNVVTSLQAGTEPFSGNNAVFKTSAYTISVA